MIIVLKEIFKRLSKENKNNDEYQSNVQRVYNEEIDKTNYNHVKCDKCQQVGNFIIHSYYTRSIRFGGITMKIRLIRVICKGCKRTHAIMFSDFIPYSRINTEEGHKILKSTSTDQIDPNISYETIINVIHRYRCRYKELFLIYNLSFIKHSIIDITRKLIDEVKLTYLQIHRGRVLSLACLDMQTT